MLTKKDVRACIEKEYSPEKFGRILGKFISHDIQYTNEMQIIVDLMRQFPDGNLSAENIQELQKKLEENFSGLQKDSSTYKTYTALQDLILWDNLAEIWKQNYFYNRSDAFIESINEFFPSLQLGSLSKNVLAGVLFTISLYSGGKTNFPYFLIGRATESVFSMIGKIFSPWSNLPKLPISLSALGTQTIFDLAFSGGGLFTATYIGGVILETGAEYIFSRFITQPKKSSNTFRFMKMMLADTSFFIGNKLTESAFYKIKETLEYQRLEEQRKQKFRKEQNHQQSSSQSQKQNTPKLFLEKHERTLLITNGACDKYQNDCKSIALKILNLDLKKIPEKRELKKLGRKAAAFFHPDSQRNSSEHCPVHPEICKDPEAFILVNAAVDILLKM